MMKKRIEVIEAVQKENQLILHTEMNKDEVKNLQATGQLLADSDQLSFIYMLDSGEDFVYLSIQSSHWPMLKKALHGDFPVYAQMDGEMILLEHFNDELQYVTENIKDNANYGEVMEQKVTEVFHTNE
ncbi:hypothetical protein [Bacillus sp. FJAT-47783]|uniref:UPF0738 family protein n=1 Tax=Bacillus sp. FJAT-47783 TaxID=2922712 RepID=UPI001FAC2736|nr:hypothetical protein [Bacillus sp. FJAT-47783]